MKGFVPLFKMSFETLLLSTANMSASRRKKKNANARSVSSIGALLLLCGIMVFISVTYSSSMASGFAPLGGLDIMLVYMLMMTTFFPIIFIIYGAQGMLFGTKDMDIVMSLPVSSFAIMLARLSALYMQALVVCECLLLPSGVMYVYYGGEDAVGVLVRMFILGAFLAGIPTLISLIVGGVVSLISARTRFKNLATILSSLLLVGGMFALIFSFSFTSGMAQSGGSEVIDIEGMRQSFYGVFPPLEWFMNALFDNLWLLMVCAGCLAPVLLVTWLFSKIYKRTLSALAGNYLRTDYKLKGMKASGAFSALFSKEAKKFFGTPAFVLNSGISAIILILVCVAAVVFSGEIQALLQQIRMGGGGFVLDMYLSPLLLGIILFFSSTVLISCVSISLEGKTLWVLKEAPLSVGKIFAAKAGFSFLLSAAINVICVPLLAYAFALPLLDALIIFAIAMLYPLMCSMAGLFINLLLPRMDATNDTMVIKQSASVIISLIFDILIVAALVGLFFLMGAFGLGFYAFAAAAAAVLLLLCALCALLLNTKGRKLFAQL